MSSPLTLWTKFFKACNLPSTVAAEYATNFVKQRIQPAMLKDLSKSELKELGVSTVGDQLAVLKHIKETDGVPPELSDETPGRRIVINDSKNRDVIMEDIPPPPSRKGKPPPDRDERYHVVMPEGRNPRTRAILERHNELKERGVISRGTSGVRVGGRTVGRLSAESRIIRKPIAASRLRDPIELPRRRIAPPMPNPAADRFASAVGIGRQRPRISFDDPGTVRYVRRIADDSVRERQPEPRVIRRIRYI